MDEHIGTSFSHYRAWRNFEPCWWWRSGKKLELLPFAAARSATRCWEGMWLRWPPLQSTNIWVACIICETRRWSVSSPTPAAAASTGRQRNQENVKTALFFLGSSTIMLKKTQHSILLLSALCKCLSAGSNIITVVITKKHQSIFASKTSYLDCLTWSLGKDQFLVWSKLCGQNRNLLWPDQSIHPLRTCMEILRHDTRSGQIDCAPRNLLLLTA